MLAARNGDIWADTADGLAKWSRGTARRFTGGGLAARSSLLEDHGGRIWVATVNGLGYLENDRFVRLGSVPGDFVYAMAQDREGSIWIANLDLGLFQLRDGRVAQQIPWSMFGNSGFGRALAPDRVQSGLWLGFSQGGLAYFRDGEVRARYGVSEGLGRGTVNGLQFDHEGTLWAATDGGLSRLKNGRVTTVSSKNGLPCDAINWVMEDDAHSLWLYTACGLVRVDRSQLDEWA